MRRQTITLLVLILPVRPLSGSLPRFILLQWNRRSGRRINGPSSCLTVHSSRTSLPSCLTTFVPSRCCMSLGYSWPTSRRMPYRQKPSCGHSHTSFAVHRSRLFWTSSDGRSREMGSRCNRLSVSSYRSSHGPRARPRTFGSDSMARCRYRTIGAQYAIRRVRNFDRGSRTTTGWKPSAIESMRSFPPFIPSILTGKAGSPMQLRKLPRPGGKQRGSRSMRFSGRSTMNPTGCSGFSRWTRIIGSSS